jgi:hypothetical protein
VVMRSQNREHPDVIAKITHTAAVKPVLERQRRNAPKDIPYVYSFVSSAGRRHPSWVKGRGTTNNSRWSTWMLHAYVLFIKIIRN